MYGRRPLTQLESAVYVVIVAVLMVTLVDRMLDMFEEAEHAMVQSTLASLYSGINMRMAQAIVQGDPVDSVEWSRRDPVELARMRLPGFLGSLKRPDLDVVDRGTWFFDPELRELIYLPRHTRTLQLAEGERALRFRMQDAGTPGAIGFRLIPVQPYRWSGKTAR